MNGRQMLLGAALALSLTSVAQAGSATWKANPGSNDWKTAANWMPATVPNADTDIATFASSNTTGVSIGSELQVGGIIFNQGASAFTITISGPTDSGSSSTDFNVKGSIVNNSGVTQNIATASGPDGPADLFLQGDVTVGDMIVITNRSQFDGGFTEFQESANAGNATILNESNGSTEFFDASAGSAMITNEGSATRNQESGRTFFVGLGPNTATAGNATIINNGGTVSGAAGGEAGFISQASAGNATLIANGGGVGGGHGGTIQFNGRTTGGTARVEVFGNGNLDISVHATHGVTVGSIEGNGLVFLGDHLLNVGSNDLDTTFAGTLEDGGLNGGVAGSLGKIGNGTLILSGPNIYTGGTSVSSGRLLVSNASGSGTGSGAVTVAGGSLGGDGTIAGAVAIGGGASHGAFLSAGLANTQPKTLTIQSTLTINSTGTLKVNLASRAAKADEIISNGVSIKSGAQFNFVAAGHTHLPSGKVFTVISNTAATPIAGTFANLSDGSTFTSNGNSYRANYEGGDGNDLTLTVQ